MAGKLAPVILVVLATAIPLLVSVKMNEGHFLYTLDDPYIHLALASGIHGGNYGINPGEATSPSSSVLWPFLLVPFVGSGLFPYAPLMLNLVFAVMTGLVLFRFFGAGNALISVISIFVFNLPGLALTGMEHGLQVLLTVLAAAGAVRFSQGGKSPRWLFPVLFLAPLVRYECLSVSVPVLVFLFLAGEKRASAITLLLLLGFLGGFSLFLAGLGLDPLPASVFAKSAVVSGAGTPGSLLLNLKGSLGSFRGAVQALLAVPLAFYAARGANPSRKRLLAAAATVAVILHLLVGRFGWFHRYGVYIWAWSVMICFALYRPFIEGHGKAFAAVLLVAGGNYLTGYIKIPYASSNIYRQQYQMSRFVNDWLDGPVAVNDLGLVALNGRHYVLDLWGLATPGALQGSADPAWVDSAAAARGVKCAIVYADQIPGIQHWRRLARMELEPPLVVCAAGGVDFLAAPWADSDSLMDMVVDFSGTLPDGIDLIPER